MVERERLEEKEEEEKNSCFYAFMVTSYVETIARIIVGVNVYEFTSC